MSGHSKWANIKRRKGAQDAKRGKIFTKMIKEITVATREGGEDPEANPRLRLAIQNAKGQNVPKDNIDRAINKGSGKDAEDYQELTYEGYGPNGIAILVECTTENINRTVSNVRMIFSKYGGSLGVNGSVEYLFDHKGSFVIKKTEIMNIDDLTLELIDGCAEDIDFDEEYISITCAKEDFGTMHHKIDELNLEMEEAGLIWIPTTSIELDDDAFQKVMKLVEAFEDDDDVQKVYHNIDVKEHQMEI